MTHYGILSVAFYSTDDVIFKTYTIRHTRDDDPSRDLFTLKMSSIVRVAFMFHIIDPTTANDKQLTDCHLYHPTLVPNMNMKQYMNSDITGQFQLYNGEDYSLSIHRDVMENIFGNYMHLIEGNDGNITKMTLPKFPTQTRPFSKRAIVLFRNYLYLTCVVEEDMYSVSLLDLLELTLIGQFLQPDCLLVRETIKLISCRIKIIVEYNSCAEIWDIAVALYCLGLLYQYTSYILPSLILHKHYWSPGMGCESLSAIITKYMSKINVIPTLVIRSQ